MKDFADFVNTMELMDYPPCESIYMWSDCRSMSRLDRFLSSPDWDAKYPEAREVMLPKYNSDHHAIMLECKEKVRKPSPFRFELMWLEEPNCLLNIKEWWNSFQVEGRASYKWWMKVKLLKDKLKVWNREEFGVVEDKIKLRVELIENLDKKKRVKTLWEMMN
ncbi:hypothetical protein FRX31_023777 [Thalictrum thalictroides]|uniref:Uncharacterized protein n=1 Tax=Thalictrum thalictroides TaxID=46969 RepID=A0A7J6VNF7_THATH|nr:hypothetical protein FRX31_023777 [Thalictrum thalictroides]